ncbi:MAG: hypothetical protein RLZZ373_3251 [Pseudomonadota bacterium]|jgi:hypothetical protein
MTPVAALTAPYRHSGTPLHEQCGQHVADMLRTAAAAVVAARNEYRRADWKNTRPLESITLEGQFFRFVREVAELEAAGKIGTAVSSGRTGLNIPGAYNDVKARFLAFTSPAGDRINEKQNLLQSFENRRTTAQAIAAMGNDD